jgi:hypothetical protein
MTAPRAAAPATTPLRKIVSRSRLFGLGANISDSRGPMRSPSILRTYGVTSGASRFSMLADDAADLKQHSLNFGAELWRSLRFLDQIWLDAAQAA